MIGAPLCAAIIILPRLRCSGIPSLVKSATSSNETSIIPPRLLKHRGPSLRLSRPFVPVRLLKKLKQQRSALEVPPINERASFGTSTERLPEPFGDRDRGRTSRTAGEVLIVDLRDATWAVDIVAHCVWQAWWHDARAREHVNKKIAQSLTAAAFPLTLVALEGEAFMGTASVIYSNAEPLCGFAPWLSALWVEPAARRRGIGSDLIDAAVVRCRALGCAELFLSSYDRTIAFYEKRQWQILSKETADISILQRIL